MEKGALHVLGILWDLVARAPFNSFAKVCIWSDGATNFKNSVFLATCGWLMLRDLRWKEFRACFGAPKHFKSSEDRHFALLKRCREDAYLQKFVTSVADLILIYIDYFHQTSIIHGEPTEHVFVDYEPVHKASLPWAKFHTWSCLGLQTSFAWTIVRNDDRRTNLVGVDGCTLTGLDLRNTLMSGLGTYADTRCHPVLEVGVPIESALPIEEEMAAPLTVETKQWRGWRTSYARHEGVSEQTARQLVHLRRLEFNLRRAVARCPASRRRSEAHLKAGIFASQLKKRRRSKHEAATFREVRRDAIVRGALDA
jgi:hypothetical protein